MRKTTATTSTTTTATRKRRSKVDDEGALARGTKLYSRLNGRGRERKRERK